MYFVRYRLSIFLISAILILLLPNSVKLSIVSSCILLINFDIYTIFLDVCPRAIYLNSVVNMETIFYFLLYQDITTPFKKKQYLITDFQSSESLAKLLSANLIRLYGGNFLDWQLFNFWPNIRPKSIVPQKYQTIFLRFRDFFFQDWYFIC